MLISGLLFSSLSVYLLLTVQYTRKMPRSEGFSLCFNSKPQLTSAFKTGILRNGKHFFRISFYNAKFLLPNRGALWTFSERDNELL